MKILFITLTIFFLLQSLILSNLINFILILNHLKIINLYHSNCNGKLSKTKIREMLKRDVFWDAKTAIENGVVDGEWKGNMD